MDKDEDEARALAWELASSLIRQPIALRYIQKVDAMGDNRIYTADDVLGERLVRLATYLGDEVKNPGRIIMNIREDGGHSVAAIRLAFLLGLTHTAVKAVPYLWTEEVRTQLGGQKLPRHVISARVLPQPTMWHTFFTGITIGGYTDYEGERYVNGSADFMLVADAVDGFGVTMFGEMINSKTGETRPTISGSIIPYGKTYPDDFEPWLVPIAESPLLMFAFLNSPYIPKEQKRASRHARREAVRLGAEVIEDEVTFVTLRRPTKKHEKVEDSQPVNWRHQWLVSGHPRAQWYPSEQAHHVIWIAPYMKGPKDAPFLEHAYKVAR